MHRLATPLLLVVLPLALFLALFHPATLDIDNAGWLIRGSDNGENALGTHAWLHDPAPGVLRTHLLNAPEGVPLLFTDSNPLIGAATWPIASLLPADAQFVGPWILLCLFLQVFFAWLLLRKFAPGPIALWCGVILLAALPTLANRYVHANLMAHWLILWALWRFLDPGRAGSNRGWAVLLLIAALVHNYLLMMVGAIWLTAMVERFVFADRRGRVVLVGGAAAILAMVAGLAWLLGAGEAHALAGNYGAFAMPIDAPINPGTPAYSRLLPSVAQRAGRGFEGFQYLGVGLLLLLPIAVVVAWKRPPADDQRSPLRRLRWLVPALVALTLLAISNYPDIAGQMLPRLPLPGFLIAALDLVRASGRLFWPVAYVLVLAAILAAYRLPRAQADGLLALLLAARYRRPWPIIAGILLATLLNHALAAWLGSLAAQWLTPAVLRWIVAISFIAIALWTLKPDTLDDDDGALPARGAFVATTIAFFIAEIGDKTQVATVLLAAKYSPLWQVVAGTTLGMLAANVPVVALGSRFASRLPLRAARIAAALVFLGLGIWALFGAF